MMVRDCRLIFSVFKNFSLFSTKGKLSCNSFALVVNCVIYNARLCVFLGSHAEVELSEGSCLSDWSPSPSPSRASQGSSSGSDSTLILESTKARKRQLVEGPLDSNLARDVS